MRAKVWQLQPSPIVCISSLERAHWDVGKMEECHLYFPKLSPYSEAEQLEVGLCPASEPQIFPL